MDEDEKLICVLCGQKWGVKSPFTNVCENEKCKGFSSWGFEPMKPESFTIDEHGNWHLNQPTKEENN